MEKLCFMVLLIFAVFIVLSYVWYVHYEVKMSIYKERTDIKHEVSTKSKEKKDSNLSDIHALPFQDLIKLRQRKFGKEMMNGYKFSKEIRILCWIMTTPKNHKTKAQKVISYNILQHWAN